MYLNVPARLAASSLPALSRAIDAASDRAESARTDATFHAAMNDACILQWLRDALQEAAAFTTPAPAILASDACPVTGQEYGLGGA